jgi:hypothetical protein
MLTLEACEEIATELCRCPCTSLPDPTDPPDPEPLPIILPHPAAATSCPHEEASPTAQRLSGSPLRLHVGATTQPARRIMVYFCHLHTSQMDEINVPSILLTFPYPADRLQHPCPTVTVGFANSEMTEDAAMNFRRPKKKSMHAVLLARS